MENPNAITFQQRGKTIDWYDAGDPENKDMIGPRTIVLHSSAFVTNDYEDGLFHLISVDSSRGMTRRELGRKLTHWFILRNIYYNLDKHRRERSDIQEDFPILDYASNIVVHSLEKTRRKRHGLDCKTSSEMSSFEEFFRKVVLPPDVKSAVDKILARHGLGPNNFSKILSELRRLALTQEQLGELWTFLNSQTKHDRGMEDGKRVQEICSSTAEKSDGHPASLLTACPKAPSEDSQPDGTKSCTVDRTSCPKSGAISGDSTSQSKCSVSSEKVETSAVSACETRASPCAATISPPASALPPCTATITPLVSALPPCTAVIPQDNQMIVEETHSPSEDQAKGDCCTSDPITHPQKDAETCQPPESEKSDCEPSETCESQGACDPKQKSDQSCEKKTDPHRLESAICEAEAMPIKTSCEDASVTTPAFAQTQIDDSQGNALDVSPGCDALQSAKRRAEDPSPGDECEKSKSLCVSNDT